jgi:ankyrin repeat protein
MKIKKNLSIRALAIVVLSSFITRNTQTALKSLDKYSKSKSIATDLMVKNNANVGTFFQAIENGQDKIISNLLADRKVDPNVTTKKGVSPLIFAAQQAAKNPTMDPQMANIVKILLKHGANPSLTDPDGKTALIWAAKGGANKTIKALLLDANIREKIINKEDDQGNSALYFASKAGNDSTVDLLLGYKEIRPTQMTAKKAKFPNIHNKIQERISKLVKEGKIQIKPLQQ